MSRLVSSRPSGRIDLIHTYVRMDVCRSSSEMKMLYLSVLILLQQLKKLQSIFLVHRVHCTCIINGSAYNTVYFIIQR